MESRPVCLVVGVGTMGTSLTYLIASRGFDVMVTNHRAPGRIFDRLSQLAAKEYSKRPLEAAHPDQLRERVTVLPELDMVDKADLKGVTIVVEAVIEDLSAKQKVWRRIESLVPSHTVLATNSSSLDIVRIAELMGQPERLVGLHFFNPAHRMELVEVVTTKNTPRYVLEAAQEFAIKLGKMPIRVANAPGYAVNRLLIPMINEAAKLVQEEVASAADVDAAMQLGAHHPMGPLHLADYIGLDVCVQILEELARRLGDASYVPCQLLRRLVDQGKLGKKAGEGFFVY